MFDLLEDSHEEPSDYEMVITQFVFLKVIWNAFQDLEDRGR